jgi:hypothetical protein
MLRAAQRTRTRVSQREIRGIRPQGHLVDGPTGWEGGKNCRSCRVAHVEQLGGERLVSDEDPTATAAGCDAFLP